MTIPEVTPGAPARKRKTGKGGPEAWDHEAWETPLSAAHLGGFSLYTFSIRQFEHAASMGSRSSRSDRAMGADDQGNPKMIWLLCAVVIAAAVWWLLRPDPLVKAIGRMEETVQEQRRGNL